MCAKKLSQVLCKLLNILCAIRNTAVCVLFSARNLCKKKIAQEIMSDVQVSCASFLYIVLVSRMCVRGISQ